MPTNIVEPADFSEGEGDGWAGIRITTRRKFRLDVQKEWSPFFRSSKLQQFLFTINMRCSLASLQDLYMGPGSVWEVDSGMLSRVMSKLLSDHLGLPVVVEARKRLGETVNLHISSGTVALCTLAQPRH